MYLTSGNSAFLVLVNIFQAEGYEASPYAESRANNIDTASSRTAVMLMLKHINDVASFHSDLLS